MRPPHVVASLLLVLVGCASARVSAVAVPPPRAPFTVALTLADDGPPLPVAALDVAGVLEDAGAERGTGALLLLVRDGVRTALATLPAGLEPERAAAWRGRPVRLAASVAADAVDLSLTDATDGHLLLLLVSRRFPDRLPGRPDDWGTPPDLPLRRVSDVSVLRTTGDENDCMALSVHYPLEVVGGHTPLRLPPDQWQPATWRGQSVALLNREAWSVRRSSCPGVEGAGFTVLVRGEPPAP